MTDFQAAIAEVLAEHSSYERFVRWDGRNETWEAVCGACGRLGEVESQEHQAAMLAPIIRDAQAEAWDAGFAEAANDATYHGTITPNPYKDES